jgi:glutaredoxin
VRDHLHAAGVEFDDRNVRKDPAATAELEALTGSVVVPMLIHGADRVVGYDPDAIDRLIAAHQESQDGPTTG